jgi:hypothetical protein
VSGPIVLVNVDRVRGSHESNVVAQVHQSSRGVVAHAYLALLVTRFVDDGKVCHPSRTIQPVVRYPCHHGKAPFVHVISTATLNPVMKRICWIVSQSFRIGPEFLSVSSCRVSRVSSKLFEPVVTAFGNDRSHKTPWNTSVIMFVGVFHDVSARRSVTL